MYKERYEMLKEAERTGANIPPIDYSFIGWYEKEAVKYGPQKKHITAIMQKCLNELWEHIELNAKSGCFMKSSISAILKKHWETNQS